MTEQLIFSLIGITGIGLTLLGFPGVYVILLSLIFFAISNGFTDITMTTLIIFGLVSVVVGFSDYIVYYFGAKRFGASFLSVIVGLAAGIIGLMMMGPLGLIIGLVAGTFVTEFIKNPDLKDALKKGGGALIGYLLGYVINIVLTIFMYIWYLYLLW